MDSDDEGEDDDFTAEEILTDKPTRGRLGGGYIKSVGRDLPHPEICWSSEQFCAELYHGLDGLSKEKEHFLGCQGRVGPFGGCSSTVMNLPWHLCLSLCLGDR